jgi:hypothetical protein
VSGVPLPVCGRLAHEIMHAAAHCCDSGMPSHPRLARTLWHDSCWPGEKNRQRCSHAPEVVMPDVHLSGFSEGSKLQSV